MRIFMTLGALSLLSIAQFSAPQALLAKKNHDRSTSSSSSSSNCGAFDAAYTQGDQSGFVVGVPTPISFATNQPGSPKNIVHPVSSDTTQFGIPQSGAYLIGWTLNLSNITAPDQVTIQLFNFTTSTVIGPDPFQIVSTGVEAPDNDSASGQTIIRLCKDTILQLLITDPVGGLVVTNPSFFITRVGD
ncbi:MAG: hypothetical protein JSR46_08140 [Verrucomicrobia bacterium]|nr:hypothetical protein [Verrucomicrobiota bacterium]